MTSPPALAEIERLLAAWQRMSQACFHAGKQPGGPWHLSIVGHCCLTLTTVRIVAVGTDETFDSVYIEIWEKMRAILTDPRLQKILDNPAASR